MGGFNLLELDAVQKAELMSVLAEYQRRRSMRLIDQMFPDAGPLRRELYPKQLEFFAAGKTSRQRAFIAANRVGKTVGVGTEWVYHLTGEYPAWWVGYRFDRPIMLLAAGDTLQNTRDIIQGKMLGGLTNRPDSIGTGLIPGAKIIGYVRNPHVPNAIERVYVKHASGGESQMWLRSYEQGREIFQGFELDGFWPDEECPRDVYEEGLIRTMDTSGTGRGNGLVTLSFTPLEGLTELVTHLMTPAEDGGAVGCTIIQCGWDDVPHLTEAVKNELAANLPPHQRDARMKGIPALGSGAVYPVMPDDIEVDDFQIPLHWHRGYGMDVGWNRTAVAFGAWDREADIIYVYSEHYRGQAEPIIHAQAIRARGEKLEGAIDPAANGRSQVDGTQLLKIYRNMQLNLHLANNGVESGIYDVWQRLSTGRLKFFKSCRHLFAEFGIYRRDKKGKIVKLNDHLMDALRYLIATLRVFQPFEPNEELVETLRNVLRTVGTDRESGFTPFDPTMGV